MFFAIFVLIFTFSIQFQLGFPSPRCLFNVNDTFSEASLNVLRKLHFQCLVVNGRAIPENGHPHLAVLMRSSLICGGSLISASYVLTAAHCFDESVDLKTFKVYLGVHDRLNLDDGPHSQKYSVAKIIMHEKYTDNPGGSVENDIALIRLDHKATFTEYVKPICLPKSGVTSSVKKANVQGWGMTRFEGPTSWTPLQGTLNVLTTEECLKTSLTLQSLGDPKTHVCAYEHYVDACTGDSGGPLLTTENKGILIGIVSTGRGCATPGYPGIYTKVEAFMDWINQHTIDSPPCTL